MKKIFIFGIVSTILLTSCSNEEQNMRDSQRINDVQRMESDINIYYQDNGKYPDTIEYRTFPIGDKGEKCNSEYNYKVKSNDKGEENECYIISTCLENPGERTKSDNGLDDNLFEVGTKDCFKN